MMFGGLSVSDQGELERVVVVGNEHENTRATHVCAVHLSMHWHNRRPHLGNINRRMHAVLAVVL